MGLMDKIKSFARKKVDERYIKKVGCTKSDFDLLKKCEEIISSAQEDTNLDNYNEVKNLLAKLTVNNRDLLAPVLMQTYKENGSEWNQAQKKVYDILVEMRILEEKQRESSKKSASEKFRKNQQPSSLEEILEWQADLMKQHLSDPRTVAANNRIKGWAIEALSTTTPQSSKEKE